jgi:hypothetical protein
MLTGVAFRFSAMNASAFCYQPSFSESPPDAPWSSSKPSVPYCLSSYSYTGKHTCDDWEVDSYFEEVNRYLRQLRDYADEAEQFANEAISYANEAIEYANCEGKDVRSQHE